MIIRSLDVRIDVFVFTAICVRLYNTCFRALCNFFSGNEVTTPLREGGGTSYCCMLSAYTKKRFFFKQEKDCSMAIEWEGQTACGQSVNILGVGLLGSTS